MGVVCGRGPSVDDVLEGMTNGNLFPLDQYILAKRNLNARGVKVAKGNPPLVWAAKLLDLKKGDAAAEKLFAAEADTSVRDEEGLSPFLAAIDNGNFGLARKLIDRGVNIAEDVDNDGNTALHRAAAFDNTPAIEFILKDPELREQLRAVKNKEGLTPFEVAAKAKSHISAKISHLIGG